MVDGPGGWLWLSGSDLVLEEEFTVPQHLPRQTLHMQICSVQIGRKQNPRQKNKENLGAFIK